MAEPERRGRGGRGAKVRRRYRFRAPAYVYLFITVLVALGAFNSQNNLLFWAFGFSLAIMLVSGVISGVMLMGVRVEREPLGVAQVGRGLTFAYRVWTRSRLIPTFALAIEEVEGRSAGGSRPWQELVPGPRAFVAHVGRRGEALATTEVRPVGRGVAEFVGVRVSSGFPFGLIGKLVEFDQPARVIVRPCAATVGPGVLAGSSGAGSSGVPTRRAGAGEEFFALRAYVPGDSWRSIAWKNTARRGTLLVRQTTAPSPPRLMVVLETAPSGTDAAAYERAVSAAAGVVLAARAQGLAVGLGVPSAGLLETPRAYSGEPGRLMDQLGLLGSSEAEGAATGASIEPGESAWRTVHVHAGVGERSVDRAGGLHVYAGDPGAFTHGVVGGGGEGAA